MKITYYALLLAWAPLISTAQENNIAPVKEPKHELGLGLIYPMTLVIGNVNSDNNHYTNLSYRYKLSPKNCIKLLAGMAHPFNASSLTQTKVLILPSNTSLVANTLYQTPSNCQFGIGFEHFIGSKQLKLFAGADFMYNNLFSKKTFFYTNAADSASPHLNKLDTGAYVSARNYNKVGIDFHFGARYEFNSKWVIMGTFTASQRVYGTTANGRAIRVNDFTINGLISDISLYYRF